MNRPDLPTIFSRVKADLSPLELRYTLSKILSHVISGTAHMLYGFIENLANSTLPDSKTRWVLEKWCSLFNVPRKLAQYSKIRIKVRASEPITLDESTVWRHESDLKYRLQNLTEINTPEDEIYIGECEVVCTTIGAQGNRKPGETLKVTGTIANLNSEAEVKNIIESGADLESDESLRNRLVTRLRRPPQGGCPYDYIAWLKALPEVEQAWVLPRPNGERGLVRLTYLKKTQNPIPNQEECNQVLEKILKICPATANIEVTPPEKVELNIVLHSDPSDELTLEEIRNEIRYLLLKKAAPMGFLNNDLKVESGVIHESDLHQAISSSPREISHGLIRVQGNIPEKSGQMVVFGSVGYAN